jgi:hypothetical protein
MAIYEITSNALRKIVETTFADAGVRERSDLQRLLRSQIDVVSPDTLIIAEEFGDWEDSRRRIDLLGIDKDANLIVIEIKRNEDGGHMELQAIRYAAMVSTMTFEKSVEVYTGFCSRVGDGSDARQALLDFLGWDEPDEDRFAQDVRMILLSAEFSKELTTAVMWLNDRDLDIRCIRIKPYADNGRVLVDVQQVIPLLEATEYQVQIREKERRERQDRADRYGIRERFWTKLLEHARGRTDLHANISPSESSWIGTGAGVRGLSYNYAITKHAGRIELYIDRGPESGPETKELYDRLLSSKEQIEAAFGKPLSWQRLDDKQACRIAFAVEGGYRDDETQWTATREAMVDAMIRFERALRPHVAQLLPRG